MAGRRSTTTPPNAPCARLHWAGKITYLQDQIQTASARPRFTAIGTTKLNGLDSEAYLREVLTRIADHPISRIEELLPWNIAASVVPVIEPAA